MAREKNIEKYQVGCHESPGLWKARRAFLSAETLRDKEHFDCAANRYYYAALHTAHHIAGWLSPNRCKWSHDTIRYECDKKQDGSGVALESAYSARYIADYHEVPVTQQRLDLSRSLVTDMIDSAMRSANIPRRTK